jgi:hypothetical protein
MAPAVERPLADQIKADFEDVKADVRREMHTMRERFTRLGQELKSLGRRLREQLGEDATR